MKENVKPFDELWWQIESNFDFDKVAKVMAFLNWGWAIKKDMDKGLAIPDRNFLIETIHERCKAVYDKGIGTSQSSGGFTITFDDDGLSVYFTLDSWTAE